MASRPRPRQSFAFRLFLGVALTLLVSGVLGYAVVARQVKAELDEAGARDLHAAVAKEAPRTEVQARSFARRLRSDGRWSQIAVVDDRGKAIVGDPRKLEDPTLESLGRRYTVLADPDGSRATAILSAVREGLLALALPTLLGSLALFWLLAGRSLHVRHRFALERAARDSLTGLGNRRAFEDELRKATSLASRAQVEVALAVFDVDDFKFLNDRRGHVRGDEILLRVARMLDGGRDQDRAFRTGGDEFALLMPATSEYEGHCAALRMRRQLAEHGISISGGLSATRAGMRSPALLREEAEAALKEAKRRRADEPVRFSEVAGQAHVLTPEKIHAVRLLIADGALDVALQPIWDLEKGTLIGCEGLARPHADYGFADPAEVFEVARQAGHVAELDKLCVSRMLQRAPQLPAGTRLFINVHPSSLDDDDEAEWLLDAMHKAKVKPDRVVIEVAERGGARIRSLIRSLDRLRSIGLKIALDGVGAGSSGLELLHVIPVDYVKVDRSIVSRAPEDAAARGVLAAVAAFARETGTYVIAEGIEDSAVLHFIRAFDAQAPGGIRGGQGYRLGRPSPTVREAIVRHGGGETPASASPAGHSGGRLQPSI
jgi:diguanylate cyclase (GGDEF)-like protein